LMIDKDYLEWLPYKNTLDRANIFFQDGKPFSNLDNGNMGNLQRFFIIRNAIAHKSTFSQQKFEQKVIASLTLTPRERKPAGYLRTAPRSSASQTQLQVVMAELRAIAQKLCA
ncbi:MAG: hypothetical protein ACOYYJ_06450, partial [Chloroflexota bacterium]